MNEIQKIINNKNSVYKSAYLHYLVNNFFKNYFLNKNFIIDFKIFIIYENNKTYKVQLVCNNNLIISQLKMKIKELNSKFKKYLIEKKQISEKEKFELSFKLN